MYKLYELVNFQKNELSTYRYGKYDGFGEERDAIMTAVNMVAGYLKKYNSTGKKAYMDIVCYDGMTVARAVNAKDTFLYRIAVSGE